MNECEFREAVDQLVERPIAELEGLGCFCSVCDDCGERQFCLPCVARQVKRTRAIWDQHDAELGL